MPMDLARLVADLHRWAGGSTVDPTWAYRLPGDPDPTRLPWEGSIPPAAARAGLSCRAGGGDDPTPGRGGWMGRRGHAIVGLVVVAVAIAVVVGLVLVSGDDTGSPAVGAVAAVQDDHLPVDPIEKIPERLDLLGDTGATTTRVDLFWADIAPSEPAGPDRSR